MVLFFVLLQVNLLSQVRPQTGTTDTNRPTGTRLDEDQVRQITSEDSTKNNKELFLEHPPRKALTYSLILPGLGQGYNKKYWKIPIVYGLLGGVGYWIYYNTYYYRHYSEEYALDQSPNNERYLKFWRRNLELSYISLVGAYALQALDAYVDANLFFWDVDPDLTVRMRPVIDPWLSGPGNAHVKYGLRCTLNF